MDLKAPPPSPIKDATEATFMADVIEASREVPVIVDFWAPWCGPCKTLAPALEKAVTEAKGKVRLVKIDVDQNQRIAAQMRVQSIPAVFAFVGGQPVDGFLGRAVAGADQGLRRPADRHVGRQRRDRGGARAGRGDARRGRGRGRGADLRGDPAEDEGNVAAIAGLARAHLALGDIERAREILALAPKGKANDPAIAAARAQIELAEASAGAGEAASSSPALERDPDDHQARYDLAMALVGKGDQRARSTRCSSCSGATASGTTARRRRSSSSCSTASAEERGGAEGPAAPELDDLRLTPGGGMGEVQPRRPAGDDPDLPAAGRAAAAARPAAAQHLRAALPRDARGHAEDPAPADRDDPAGACPRARAAAAAPDRLRRPGHRLPGDRGRALPDHPLRGQPLPRRRGAGGLRPYLRARGGLDELRARPRPGREGSGVRPRGVPRRARRGSSTPRSSRRTGTA